MTDSTKKQGKSVSSDDSTSNITPTAMNIISFVEAKECKYATSDDKALRKKLKKERQKDKKNGGKEKMEITSENNDVNKSEIVTSARKKDTPIVDCSNGDNENNKNSNNYDNDDDDDDDDNDDDDAESTDIDFSIVAPAFVKSSIVSKKDTIRMLKKVNDNVKGKNSGRDTNHKLDKLFPDESDGFTYVKKGTKQAPASFFKTPEGFGNQALVVIGLGNFPLAIEYLTRAIALDSTDRRHYINRSYCYLRMGNYAQALVDIKFASEHFSDVTERARAKCREGQALSGLQNYEAAERAFEECIKLTPHCPYAKRELKRVQILQLSHMGFNERDAILALEKKPNTMEALILLTENPSTNNEPDESAESASDDEIFYSDTEECPSNERLLSKILNYDPNLPDETHIPEPPPANKIINVLKQPSRAASLDRGLRVIKTIQSPVKPKPSNQSRNEMALWVGNMTPHITDAMMTKRFGRFGKVIQVWRSPTASFAFINYQCAGSAKKALEEASSNGGNIDVNGHLLPIKSATAKTFK